MRGKRRIMAWLLIFVLTVSLMPGNMVKVAAAEDEGNVYNVWVNPNVSYDTGYSEEDTFTVSVPLGQEGVTTTDDENYEVSGSITIEVTVPDGCDVNYLTLWNNDEQLEDVDFKASGDNTYSVTVTPADDMKLSFRDNTYSFTTSALTSDTNITFQQKMKITSDVAVIPCQEDGTILDGYDEKGVTEFYASMYTNVYFKLADAETKYMFQKENETVGCCSFDGDVWIYTFQVEEQDVELSATPLKVLTIKGDYPWGNASPNADSAPAYHFEYKDGKWDYYLSQDEVQVKLSVERGYDCSEMQVTLVGKDGTSQTLDMAKSKENQSEEQRVYACTVSLTQNAEIDVTGIYSTGTEEFWVEFEDEAFQNVSVEVIDEEGNSAEKGINSHVFNLYDRHSYYLKLSSETVDLTGVRGIQNGTEIAFKKGDDNSYTLALDSTDSICLGLKTQSYVKYVCDDELDRGYPCILGTKYDETFKEFQSNGNHQIWVNATDAKYDTSDAVITKVTAKNENDEDVEITDAIIGQEKMTVNDYGDVRTVYTVNVTQDITIHYSGVKIRTGDVYMPLPTNADGYKISGISVSDIGFGDDYDGDEEQIPVYTQVTGVDDAENGYTKYSGIKYDRMVRFDVTVPQGKQPLVQKKTSDAMVVDPINALVETKVISNGDNTETYSYSFCLRTTTEILITLNTKELVVTTKDGKGYVEYDQNEHCWNIYDKEDEDTRTNLCWLNLPKLMDAGDTDTTYNFHVEFATGYYDEESVFQRELYRIKKGTGNALFTAYDENDTPYTSLAEDAENPEEGGYALPSGCYKLVVDTSCIIPYVNYIHLESDRDDIQIAPAGEAGQDYDKLVVSDEAYYIPLKDTDTFSFTLTAEEKEDFDDVSIYWASTDHDEDYVESTDGLTRTYTLKNIEDDASISVGYPATFCLKQVEGVNLTPNFYYNDEDENGVVNNLTSGQKWFLNVGVETGYDPDSVKVIQEVNGVVVNTLDVYGGYAYHGVDRWCDIELLPGDNVFYATEPEKATYKMDLSPSTAYTIELVNGSKTTVEYGESFSFKVKGNEGYDLSGMIVTADGQRLTPDKDGVYTVTNITQDYDIEVTGYKTNSFIVTFKDYNGNVIGKSQTVEFGKNATAPATPSRKGYTFAGWDRSFSNVKQNLVVTATYKQIFVNKIEISSDITKLAPEKTVTLNVAVTPENALNTGVTWTSSNTKYATVDANGKVKALKAGAGKKVTITATAKDGSGKKAVYKIAIQKKAVKKITLSAKSKSVKPGKKVTVSANISPSKGINKTLVWTSSNEKYATVNSKGVVTTKKAGKGKTVVITAAATDGSGKKATIKIKIKKK
jgi:uncharacterized protein YjdB